jgi:hypothetical protein
MSLSKSNVRRKEDTKPETYLFSQLDSFAIGWTTKTEYPRKAPSKPCPAVTRTFHGSRDRLTINLFQPRIHCFVAQIAQHNPLLRALRHFAPMKKNKRFL